MTSETYPESPLSTRVSLFLNVETWVAAVVSTTTYRLVGGRAEVRRLAALAVLLFPLLTLAAVVLRVHQTIPRGTPVNIVSLPRPSQQLSASQLSRSCRRDIFARHVLLQLW
jgi:hypothetical protein